MGHSGEGCSIFYNFVSNSQRAHSSPIVGFVVKPKSKFVNLSTDQEKLKEANERIT